MKIVVAFDSFKGCLSAEEACRAASEGIHAVVPAARVVEVPLSDGGEGLVACVRRMIPVVDVTLTVHGPLMERVACGYVLSSDGKCAYMEMAAARGRPWAPVAPRPPTRTTSLGGGEMIAAAMNRGCERIVMGIGGSATCDAGEGMLEALRAHGCLPAKCSMVVACDVINPLYGEQGAAYVFAPQKGATPEQVRLLDERLRAFASATERAGIATSDIASPPAAAAPRRYAKPQQANKQAELRSGIDIVLDIARFNQQVEEAKLVLTGEGKSDVQTLMGKVPYGVLQRCRRAGVAVWLLSGAIDDADSLLDARYDCVQSINEGDDRPLRQLLRPEVARENLRRTVERLCASIRDVEA